jgi:hypothetical protein
VKKLIAIIFSAALVTAQLFASADTAPTPVQKQSRCDCGKAKCCAAKSSDASKEIPAVPAPSSSQKSFQIVLTLTAWAMTPQTISEPQLIFAGSTPLPAQSVPIFTRDCSYLL